MVVVKYKIKNNNNFIGQDVISLMNCRYGESFWVTFIEDDDKIKYNTHDLNGVVALVAAESSNPFKYPRSRDIEHMVLIGDITKIGKTRTEIEKSLGIRLNYLDETSSDIINYILTLIGEDK